MEVEEEGALGSGACATDREGVRGVGEWGFPADCVCKQDVDGRSFVVDRVGFSEGLSDHNMSEP